jgi:hypothetical protein
MQEINPQNFKISCSRIGEIMGNQNAKTKAEKVADMEADIKTRTVKRDALRDGLASKATATEKIKALEIELQELKAAPEIKVLSDGAKTLCREWVTTAIYERKKAFTSKYTDKGTATENDAIKLLNGFYGWKAEKNETRKFSEYIHGECDIHIPKIRVEDIKVSYSCFTFPLFENVIPDKKYEWQVRGYGHLWNVPVMGVSYCLMDMPDDMIAQELRYRFKSPPSEQEYREAAQEFYYSHMPDELRIKSFEFEHDQKPIDKICENVVLCREYISSLLENL